MATQTVVQEQRLPAFQEEFLKDIFASAQALQDVSQPYAPEQLAGLSAEQQQAVQMGLQGIGAYQPFMQQAAALAGPQGYQAFMSPFTQDVIDQSMKDIARGGAMQQNQLAGQAAGAGAFGGSRAAVASGELARGTLEQQARTAAQLRESGFQQAQQLAGQRSALFSGLGQLGQQLGTQDINTLLGLGGMTQQQSQAAARCRSSQLAGTAGSAIPAGWLYVRYLPWCSSIAVHISDLDNTTAKHNITVAWVWVQRVLVQSAQAGALVASLVS